MREHSEITLAARTEIHVAALTRHGDPVVSGIDKTGHAEAGARSEHDTRSTVFHFTAANIVAMLGIQ